MSEKKSQINKRALILSIFSLAIAVGVLVFATYAWFTTITRAIAPQEFTVNPIEIVLSDDAESNYTATSKHSVLALDRVYPSTASTALSAYNDGSLSSYIFSVQNLSDAPAQYRIFPTVVSDSNYGVTDPNNSLLAPLALQFCLGVRTFTDPAALTDKSLRGSFTCESDIQIGQVMYAPDNVLLFKNSSSNDLLSGKGLFNYLLLNESNGEYTGNDLGTLASNSTRYFEVIIWLSPAATTESTGADITNPDNNSAHTNPSLTFAFTCEALQVGGGASFFQAAVQDSDTDYKPTA